MRRLYGPSYVASYLGYSLATVYLWIRDPKTHFPQADVVIVGKEDVVVAQGWTSESLRLMRPWLESRRNMDPDQAERWWAKVDNDLHAAAAAREAAAKAEAAKAALERQAKEVQAEAGDA